MAVKITIPVEFKDTAQSYKQIITSLEGQLKKVKPGSAIYDNLSEQLKKARKMLEKLDLNFDAGIGSYTDIDKIERNFASLARTIEELKSSLSSLDFSALNVNFENFGQLYTDLVNARKQLDEAQAKFEQTRGYSTRQLISSEDQKTLGFTEEQLSKTGLTFFDELKISLSEANAKLEEAKIRTKEYQDQLAELEERKSQASHFKIDEEAEKIINIAKSGSVTKVKQNLYDELKQNFFDNQGQILADKSEAMENLLVAFGLDR